jgi:hypothetical protein
LLYEADPPAVEASEEEAAEREMLREGAH